MSYAAPRGASIKKGSIANAGDLDAWVSDHGAVPVLRYHYRDDQQGQTWPRELDAFDARSFLAWLAAWQKEIDIITVKASAALVEYHNKSLDRAQHADAGIIDYSQYE